MKVLRFQGVFLSTPLSRLPQGRGDSSSYESILPECTSSTFHKYTAQNPICQQKSFGKSDPTLLSWCWQRTQINLPPFREKGRLVLCRKRTNGIGIMKWESAKTYVPGAVRHTLAGPAGVEPAPSGFGVRCSGQLSYGPTYRCFAAFLDYTLGRSLRASFIFSSG